MEQALQQGRFNSIEELFATDSTPREDQLSALSGLRLAVLLGAGLWAMIIFAVLRFAL